MNRFTTIINSMSAHNLPSITLFVGSSLQEAVKTALDAINKFNGKHKIVIFDGINFANANETETKNLNDDEYNNVMYVIEVLAEKRNNEDDEWEMVDSATFATLFCVDNVDNIELEWKD